MDLISRHGCDVIAHFGSVKVLNRIKKLSIEEGLELISKSFFELNNIIYKVSEDRLDCFFHKGTICVGCNLAANFFAIEEVFFNPCNKITLNLYGIKDNKERYFTKDHIIPKSKNGADTLDNYQPMCWECNALKGNKILF